MSSQYAMSLCLAVAACTSWTTAGAKELLDETDVILNLQVLGAVVEFADDDFDRPVRSVSFRSTNFFGDPQLPLLESLRAMTTLKLTGTSVTNPGMEDLIKLRSLKELDLLECENVALCRHYPPKT